MAHRELAKLPWFRGYLWFEWWAVVDSGRPSEDAPPSTLDLIR
jgi:hypothetical protein